MQDTRRRNLRKASRTAVGPVRPVRLNNLHKHSHGLRVSATFPASDLGLCLSLEPLRNTVLLVGEEVVENDFSIFRSGTLVNHRPSSNYVLEKEPGLLLDESFHPSDQGFAALLRPRLWKTKERLDTSGNSEGQSKH